MGSLARRVKARRTEWTQQLVDEKGLRLKRRDHTYSSSIILMSQLFPGELRSFPGFYKMATTTN
uniref:Uncharacterized protein n=1 Tax=Hyaloperonospora arabidopsidis (strain Emoy2) TaxID=559515 RepID=M4BIN4_HYAAE